MTKREEYLREPVFRESEDWGDRPIAQAGRDDGKAVILKVASYVWWFAGTLCLLIGGLTHHPDALWHLAVICFLGAIWLAVV